MNSGGRPWWQQVTALVSLGAGGAITGFSLVPQAAAAATSPASMPLNLLALHKAAQPAQEAARVTRSGDAALRSAIINVAAYYLRMAQSKTPAQMQALIWQHDSTDGADHGESCAAFASMTLQLAAQVVGRASWVTGGASYPWPLHQWADVRVDPNPASPSIVSILQDAQAHGRWHPLGDGYRPQPGDWVLFNGHVEVVTRYADGTLDTIGADSLPGLTVNAHQFSAPLAAQGITGFVDNGEAPARAGQAPGSGSTADGGYRALDEVARQQRGIPGGSSLGSSVPPGPPAPGGAALPGMSAPGDAARPGMPARIGAPGSGTEPDGGHAVHDVSAPAAAARHAVRRTAADTAGASLPGGIIPGLATVPEAAAAGAAWIPGAAAPGRHEPGHAAGQPLYVRHDPAPLTASGPDAAQQRAFIAEVAPGAVAAQRKYGVPAAATIAQAIDESGWGHSYLAQQGHNLFGIKGNGPGGSDLLVTQEYENGRYVTEDAPFRVYRDIAESINDHGRLLATSGYYQRAMAERYDPDAFASALTGVYATDPDYGTKLIGLMREYDLYRYDAAGGAAQHAHGSPAAQDGLARTGAQHADRVHGDLGQGHAHADHATRGEALVPGAPPAPAGPVPAWQRPAAPAAAADPTSASRAPAAPPLATDGPAAAPAQAGPSAPPAEPGSPGAAAEPAPSAPSVQAGTSAPSAMPQAPRDKWSQEQASRSRPAPASEASPQASTHAQSLPPQVKRAFLTAARAPLSQHEPVYRDVASQAGIGWQLLAACDWMQCDARPGYSPVHGERLGTANHDGTRYRTKSAALERCAEDLVELSRAVYGIDLTAPGNLSVRELANVFAAFRWGALLRRHHTSAMEFPYSVAGLTAQHLKMRWPDIAAPNAPDKPGTRFRRAFGAVPVVLSLHYQAIA